MSWHEWIWTLEVHATLVLFFPIDTDMTLLFSVLAHQHVYDPGSYVEHWGGWLALHLHFPGPPWRISWSRNYEINVGGEFLCDAMR